MLRFNSPHRRSRNYFSRKEQWRLLLLVMSLGVVVIVMRHLQQPDGIAQVAQVFAAQPERAPDAVQVSKTTSTPREAATLPNDAGDNSNAGGEPPTTTSGAMPAFLRELFADVKDNTYFRRAEQRAWFDVIKSLQSASADQIAAAHSIEANYVQLVDQPDFYRGKLVTAYGWVRQVTKQEPAANDLGLTEYYRVVIQPTDGSDWPIFIYCLTLPPELHEGEYDAGSMKVTGVFFKNLSYAWSGGMGTAPVILAKSIEWFGAAPGEPGVATNRPVGADTWNEAERPTSNSVTAAKAESPVAPSTSFREILAVAGWDVARLAAFDDGQPFSNDQRAEALRLLMRLRSFNSTDLAGWVHEGLAPYYMLTKPDDYRGQLVHLSGHVIKVSKRTLDPETAARLEMPEYYECQLELDKQAGTATVLTTRVPQSWLNAEKLNEPAAAVALYLKRTSQGDPPPAVWLAKEIAWYPETVNEPLVSASRALLGAQRMDVGLLDNVRPRGPIRAEERAAFYQLLAAASGIDAPTLIQSAQGQLNAIRARWARELRTNTDNQQRALAAEVIQRADAGRFSVAPLFNRPQDHVGELAVFDGLARRVVRVQANTPAENADANDVARRLGIDAYYELEVFTDDSQNYPLVFCVRELPAGFPAGDHPDVPVRVAGFFFKDWLYTTRGTSASSASDDAAATTNRAQYAPLLIGRAPIVIEIAPTENHMARVIAAGLFVLALAAVWATAWWFARGDRKFARRLQTTAFSPDPGQNLNELSIPEASGPVIFSPPAEHYTGDSVRLE